jgi:hypothetical protein
MFINSRTLASWKTSIPSMMTTSDALTCISKETFFQNNSSSGAKQGFFILLYPKRQI